MTISVRLSDEEAERLQSLIETNNTTGFETKSEFLRLLIAREWNRNRGLPKPKPTDWQTAARIGRPREETDPRMRDPENHPTAI